MILITRPFEDAKYTGKALKSQGYNCFIEPMLEVEHLDADTSAYDDVEIQSFITTSKHARKLLDNDAPLASLPEQGKDGEELLQWITANLKPDGGKLVYLRGKDISVDICSILRKQGYDIDEVIVYKTLKPACFSERLLRNFPKITFASFYSKQTLTNFLELAAKHQLSVSDIQAICLSEEIAHLAENAGFKQVYFSAEPDAASMINKIREVC